MTFSREMLYRIHDEQEGVFIEVGEYPDDPPLIEIRVPDRKSKTFYGDFKLMLELDQAEMLANSLLAAVNAKRAVT